MRQSRVTSWVVIAMAASLWTGAEAAVEWPQEIDAEEGTIVVYQPQPERLDGNVLTGRAAMSLGRLVRNWFAAVSIVSLESMPFTR